MEHTDVDLALQQAVDSGDVDEVLDLLEKKKRNKSQFQEPISVSNWGSHLFDCDVLVKLKELGAGINDQCERGFTPLHWAAFNGQLENVNRLLEEGADKSVVSNDRFTVLHSAVKARKVDPDTQVKIIDALFNNEAEAEVEVDAKDKKGDTPLIWASTFGHLMAVKKLIEYDAEPKATNKYCATALHWAARNGHVEVVEYLIEKGAKVNAKNNYGDTPLTWAASNDKGDVVVKLVERGGEVDAVSNEGYTPLHWAAYHGKLSVIKMLINDNKMNVKIKGKFGREAIHRAVSNKKTSPKIQLEVVNFLNNCGAGVLNAVDDNGNTPLVWAICDGHFEVAKKLIDMNADPTISNNIGATALHWAACYGQKYWIDEWLYNNRIFDVNVKDNNNRTPLFWAVNYWGNEKKCKNAVEVLLRYGACVNRQDKLGLTPLHWASINGNENLVKILANNGACTKVKDNDGLTPLQLLVATKT